MSRFLRGSDCLIDAEVDEMLICTDKDATSSSSSAQKRPLDRQDSWRDNSPYATPRFLKVFSQVLAEREALMEAYYETLDLSCYCLGMVAL